MRLRQKLLGAQRATWLRACDRKRTVSTARTTSSDGGRCCPDRGERPANALLRQDPWTDDVLQNTPWSFALPAKADEVEQRQRQLLGRNESATVNGQKVAQARGTPPVCTTRSNLWRLLRIGPEIPLALK